MDAFWQQAGKVPGLVHGKGDSMRRILLAFLLSCLAGVVQAGEPAIGDVPPPHLGIGRDGKPVNLEQLRGKVVVVTFWASWCGYCLKELPVLDVLQKNASDKWLQVVAVNVEDGNQEYRAMMRQMKDYGIAMTRDRNGAIARGYGVNAYPNLWIVDPQGRMAVHHRGYSEDALEVIINEINQILREDDARRAQAKATAD